MGIDIEVAAKAHFASFYHDSSFNFSKYKQQMDYSNRYSMTKREIYIGGTPPTNGDVRAWAQTVTNNPMAINYKLIDLGHLFKFINVTGFDTTSAVTSFQGALENYVKQKGGSKPAPDKPKPPSAALQWSDTHSFGSVGKSQFDWKDVSYTRNAYRFMIRHGKYVDNIQMALSDGISDSFSPSIGGSGGSMTTWDIGKDDSISRIEFWYDHHVQALLFHSYKGKTSPLFGRKGGHYATRDIESGYRIVGFFGNCDDLVERLGFKLAKTTYPSHFEESTISLELSPE